MNCWFEMDLSTSQAPGKSQAPTRHDEIKHQETGILNLPFILYNVKGDRYRMLEKAYRAIKSGDKSLQCLENTVEVESQRVWLSQESKRGLNDFLHEKNNLS